MHLYNQTLSYATNVSNVAGGHFCNDSDFQMVISHGSSLTMYVMDGETIQSTQHFEVFGIVRCIKRIHINDYEHDLLVMTSDSGKLTIIEYKQSLQLFVKISEKEVGTSGCLRSVPGQYLTINADSTFIAIGSVEGRIAILPVHFFTDQSGSLQITCDSWIYLDIPNTLIHSILLTESNSLACIQQSLSSSERVLTTYSTPFLEKIDSVTLPPTASRLFQVNHRILITMENALFDSIPIPLSTAYPSSLVADMQEIGGNCIVITDKGEVFAYQEGSVRLLASSKMELRQICNHKEMVFIFSAYGHLFHLEDLALRMDSKASVLCPCVNCTPFKDRLIVTEAANGLSSMSSMSSIRIGMECKIEAFTKPFQKKITTNGANGANGISEIKAYAIESIGTISSSRGAEDAKYVLYSMQEGITSVAEYSEESGHYVSITEPFITKESTLSTGLCDGLYVQIVPSQVLFIKKDKKYSWVPPSGSKILSGIVTENYVFVGLDSRVLSCIVKKEGKEEGKEEESKEIEMEEVEEVDNTVENAEIADMCVMSRDTILIGLRDGSVIAYGVMNEKLEQLGVYPIASITQMIMLESHLYVSSSEGKLYCIAVNSDNGEHYNSVTFVLLHVYCMSSSPLTLSPIRYNQQSGFVVTSSCSHPLLCMASHPYQFTPLLDSPEPVPYRYATITTPKKETHHFLWFGASLAEFTLTQTTTNFGKESFPSLASIAQMVRSDRGDDALLFGSGLLLLDAQGYRREITGVVKRGETITKAACTCYGEGKWVIVVAIMRNACEYELRGYLCSQDENIIESSLLYTIPLAQPCYALHLHTSKQIVYVTGASLVLASFTNGTLSMSFHTSCTSTFITASHLQEDRLYLTDNSGVLSLFRILPSSAILLLKQSCHRSLMRLLVLDASTVAVSDKFGDILVYRANFSSLDEETMTPLAYSMSLVAATYVGALVTSLETQHWRSRSSILYTTIMGTIGKLTLVKAELQERIQELESLLMGIPLSLGGRVIDDYHSTFIPSSGVIDGDVCKLFFKLTPAMQEEIARKMRITVYDVTKLLLKVMDDV